ncbi:TetR/AcrR family transcriptional regulator [Actinomadura fibrosa]|uniref:TetR/AcrR family transcriptional regulator n=1 Tax=Actinomadura fibrosa TaxID=111802 RepID=A0ABW2XHH9_9ACTN|nr:TetR/AcrR family transcriptional regulator [Actinomadura fibrosa]
MERARPEGTPRRERADAVRNRRAILLAAHRLICENGVDQVSMNDIAAEAGVGKGTLFRRFGDREGLIHALFEQLTADWEPGALARLSDPATPPLQRVLGFITELFDHVTVPGRPLLRAMGGHPRAERLEHYRLWLGHLTKAVAEARPDLTEGEAAFMAHVVLNTPRAQFVELLEAEAGLSSDDIRAGIVASTYATLSGPRLPSELLPPVRACAKGAGGGPPQ